MDNTRTSQRFPVHLPLKVLGETQIPAGSTENISAGGVYLWIDGKMEVGSEMEFEITIPGEAIGGVEDVGIRCEGRVVRCDTESESEHAGIACVIEQYEFLRKTAAGGE